MMAKSMLMLLILFTIVLLFCDLSTLAFDCAHRNYGFDGTVCVCNATYCDNIPSLTKTQKGVITAYLTSLSGDRFHKSQLHFSTSPNASSATNDNKSISITIDHSRKYQKFIGFGGAFTDATGSNVARLPKEMQIRLIKDYFGEDGLEYSLGRIPIGGSDYSPRPYTYHEFVDDDNLTKFALQPEDLNYKIPFIHLAQQVSPHSIRLFGSPWSAPTWIKTNHEVNHGGFIIGKPGERYYKIFARYFVKFIEEYAKQKVNIWGITVENEPSAGYNAKYAFNSLGFNSALERDFVKLDLGPALHENGHEQVKLMIYDDSMHRQEGAMERFITEVLSDKEAEKFVSGIAYHWYIQSNRSELERIHLKFPNHFILGSEACELHPPKLGKWSIMEKYALFIIRDLNHFSSGWTDWNMALDPLGQSHWDEPTNQNYSYNSPLIVNATAQEYYKQPHFYTMGHFSKFIQPDSVRIHLDVHPIESTNVNVTVFERPDNATVLVVLNQNKHAVQLQVHDPQNGFVKVEVKAHALETLIWY